MATYNLPRNVKGEGRILYIFSVKSLIYTTIGVAFGLIFYFLFSAINLKPVGIFFVVLFGAIGYAIAMLKVPKISFIKSTQKVAGENIDEIIKRAIKFKQKKSKIYVYDDKGGETEDE